MPDVTLYSLRQQSARHNFHNQIYHSLKYWKHYRSKRINWNFILLTINLYTTEKGREMAVEKKNKLLQSFSKAWERLNQNKTK